MVQFRINGISIEKRPDHAALTPLLAVVWLLSGCAPPGPGLEVFQQSEWIELGPITIESVVGERRGADVDAVGHFTHGGDPLRVSMRFVLGPPARLVDGSHFSRLGDNIVEGAVSAESVTFLGGQNTQPSIGAVLILENPGSDSKYRLRFPPTMLQPPF